MKDDRTSNTFQFKQKNISTAFESSCGLSPVLFPPIPHVRGNRAPN